MESKECLFKMSQNKKRRNKNLSAFERNFLIELCKSHPEIEDKGYSSQTVVAKSKAWERIAEEFSANSLVSEERSKSFLKGCWKRIKIEAKKAVDERRNHARKTGGGPPLPPLSEGQQSVAELIGDGINPLENPFDPESPIISWDEEFENSSNEIFSQFDQMKDVSYEKSTPQSQMTTNFDQMKDVLYEKSTPQPQMTTKNPVFISNLKRGITNTLRENLSNVTRVNPVSIHITNRTPTSHLKASSTNSTPVAPKRSRNAKDENLPPIVKRRTIVSMKSLQEEALLLAKKNEEEKLKQNELKTRIAEIELKNMTEILAANQYKTMAAKAEYETQLMLKEIADVNMKKIKSDLNESFENFKNCRYFKNYI